jgi:hypothetical protein
LYLLCYTCLCQWRLSNWSLVTVDKHSPEVVWYVVPILLRGKPACTMGQDVTLRSIPMTPRSPLKPMKPRHQDRFTISGNRAPYTEPTCKHRLWLRHQSNEQHKGTLMTSKRDQTFVRPVMCCRYHHTVSTLLQPFGSQPDPLASSSILLHHLHLPDALLLLIDQNLWSFQWGSVSVHQFSYAFCQCLSYRCYCAIVYCAQSTASTRPYCVTALLSSVHWTTVLV